MKPGSERSPTVTGYCAQCGAIVVPGDRFCELCGKEIQIGGKPGRPGSVFPRRRLLRRAVPWLLVLSALSVTGALFIQASVAPHKVGAIAFVSDREGYGQLYVVRADGLEVKRLTHFVGRVAHPSWSPDGQRITFVSDHKQGPRVFVIEVERGTTTAVTHASGDYRHPIWSPDGRRIAFASTQVGVGGIYMVNADGSGLRSLTRALGSDFYEGFDWSPDGRILAVVLRRDGEIYLVDVDTGLARRLTTGARAASYPVAWSPDHRRIAYVSSRHGNHVVYVTDIDGTALIKMTGDAAHDGAYGVAWSPDGRRLAFTSDRDGRPGIFTMNANGEHQRRLVACPQDAVGPSWSPDGSRIAYFSAAPGEGWQVFVVGSGGGEPARVASVGQTIMAARPAWRPR